jgi:hypothetical protein
MKKIIFILFLIPLFVNSQQIEPLYKPTTYIPYRNYANLAYMGDLKSPIGFALGNQRGTFFFIGSMNGFGKPDYTNIISPSTPTTFYGDKSLGGFTDRYVLGYIRSLPFKNSNDLFFDFGGGIGGLLNKQTYYDATGILSPNNTYSVGDNKSEYEIGVIGGISYYSNSMKYNIDLSDYTSTGFNVMFGVGFLLFKINTL